MSKRELIDTGNHERYRFRGHGGTVTKSPDVGRSLPVATIEYGGRIKPAT